MKDVREFVNILREIYTILLPKQRKKSIFVVVTMIFAAIFEVLGVSVIVPFIYAMIDIESLRGNKYIELIVKIFNIKNNMSLVYLLGGGVVGIFLIKNLCLIYARYVQIKFQCNTQQELSTMMLQRYMEKPYEYFLNNNSVIVLRAINGDISAVYSVLNCYFIILSEAFTMLGIISYLLYLDGFMAIGIGGVGCLCVILITQIFRKRLAAAGKCYFDMQTKTNQYAHQAVNGIKEISVMHRRDYFVNEYDQAYLKLKKSQIEYNAAQIIPERIIEVSFVAGIIGILILKMSLSEVSISEYVPTLAAFALGGFRLLPSVNKISVNFGQIIYFKPSVESAYLNICNNSLDVLCDSKCDYPTRKLQFNTQIEVKDVVWKYKNSEKKILDNVSFTINKGEAIGFIGESGAGKTTLSDIILGLLKPQNGKILVDGIDINDLDEEWAHLVGYVPQTVYLIDDSISANVTFGLPKSEIEESKIWEALDKAQLKTFVESLPNGLDTYVGERGIRISGGQRQRIAIARALYQNPSILVLDEATAALDNETERAVMEAIEGLRGKVTLIIVAHRLSTIKTCNRVFEVKKGKVYETKIQK